MRKTLRAIILFFLVITIVLSLPATAFAYNCNMVSAESLVSVDKKDNVITSSLSSDDIVKIKGSKRFDTNSEKLENVLSAVGYTEQLKKSINYSAMPDMDEIDNVRTSDYYLKTHNNDGTSEIISEQECFAEVTELENSEISTYDAISNAHQNGEGDTDKFGYMHIVICAFYTPNYDGPGASKGRYVIMAGFEWLKTPITRLTDSISISCPQINWFEKYNDVGYENYLLAGHWQMISRDNSTGAQNITDCYLEKHANEVGVEDASKGVYYKIPMPPIDFATSAGRISYDNFTFTMMAVGRLKNYGYKDQSISVYVNYSHVRIALSLNIDFGWSSDNNGFKFGAIASLTTGKTDYPTILHWDYADDFNL